MDASLRQAVDALFDPAHVSWSFVRPDPGAEPGVQEFFIGSGTREAHKPAHPRMLNWKLPQWRESKLRSSTEAVFSSAASIDAATFPLTIRSHEPTLDVTVGALLTVFRKLNGRWPDAAEALVDYVSDWEQGRTEQAGPYDRALASVFYASMYEFRRSGSARGLVEIVAEVLSTKPSGTELATLAHSLIPHVIARRLKADADLYRTELSRAWKVQLDLPLDASDGGFRRIDALFLSSPQDVTVLKLLARPDAVASSYGRGFELMAVHAPNEHHAWGRHTISITPESAGTLNDLALCLDRSEGPSKPDGTARAKGQPRFTYQPAELEGLSDPWYSDGYASTAGRSTIVAPPFVGTRLSREQIWETIWQRFHVGANVHVTASRTIFVKPARVAKGVEGSTLEQHGFTKTNWSTAAKQGLMPAVAESFFGGGDVAHYERAVGERTLRISLYPSRLALIWIEQTGRSTTLLELAHHQAQLATSKTLDELAPLKALSTLITPMELTRWHVYGAYRINRARSTMLDGSRSIVGLFHGIAAGESPTLANLPTEAESSARTVQSHKDVEHWLTSTGGARVELMLDDRPEPPPLDSDFSLFLLTTGQRFSAFEITRRMGELDRQSRSTRWSALAPSTTVRADVMFFTNSLWYPRVSDEPDLNARYDAWRALHGVPDTVEALRSQTAELDEYRKERFEKTTGLLVLLFLPVTMATGFFSGAQFNEMDMRLGLPWTTGGWKVFLIYTAVFSLLVAGALVVARLFSWRRR